MHNIDKHECIECGFCASICPKKAIKPADDYAYEIGAACVDCSLCLKNCPVKAINS